MESVTLHDLTVTQKHTEIGRRTETRLETSEGNYRLKIPVLPVP